MLWLHLECTEALVGRWIYSKDHAFETVTDRSSKSLICGNEGKTYPVCSQKNQSGVEALVTVKLKVGCEVLLAGWKPELAPEERGVQGSVKVD